MGCGDSDVDELSDKEEDNDTLVFSSRFQKKQQQQTQLACDQMPTEQLDNMSIGSRPSTSAPSTQSPFRIQASSSAPTVGFTFSSNIPAWQSVEERESYALFLAVMEKDYWKSVSTIRSTYFFDGIGRGGGFLAVSMIRFVGRFLNAWIGYTPFACPYARVLIIPHHSVSAWSYGYLLTKQNQYSFLCICILFSLRSLIWLHMGMPRRMSSVGCWKTG